MRVRSLSSRGGEKDGSSRCGGCGNRDNENVDCVGVVCASLEYGYSAGKLTATCKVCIGKEFALAEGKRPPADAGGLGSLFLELK